MGWTTLLNAVFLPGKPILGSTGLALRDNILAVPKGEAGAERIVGAAHKRLADMPVLATTASNAFNAASLVSETVAQNSTTSASYVIAFAYTVLRATGSLRFRVTQNANDDGTGTGEQSQLRLVKNGTEVTSWTTTANGQVREVDLAVVPGDSVVWEHRRTNGNVAVNVVGQQVLGSDAYTERPAYVSQLLKDVP